MDFLRPSLPPFECCPHTISPRGWTIQSSLCPRGHNLEPHRIAFPLDADSRMGRIEQDEITEFNQQQTSWVKLILTSSSSYKESPARKRKKETSNWKMRSTVLSRRAHLKLFSFEKKKELFSLFPLFYRVEISFLWLIDLDKRIKLIFCRAASILKQCLDAWVPPTPLVLALAHLSTFALTLG